MILCLLIINLALAYISINFYRNMKWAQINTGKLNYYSSYNSKLIQDTKKKRCVLFGDSRILQWNILPVLNNCEMINRGISGDTTSSSLLRIKNDVIKLKPDIVIIQLGINDLTTIGISPECYDFIKGICISNLDSIIDILINNNISVIILTIIPNSKVSIFRRVVWSDRIENAINEVNEYINQINRSNTFIINCNKIFIDDNNKIQTDYYKDTIHMNQKAYIELNTIVEPVLNSIINNKMDER